MKCISWNVNSIRALLKKEDLLNNYLQKSKPQIFCISETKLSFPDQKDIDMLKEKIKGFRYRYYNTSKARKGYSGVAIFSKTEAISCATGIDAPMFDKEGRSITLEFNDYYLINVYVPNSGQNLDRLKDRISKWDRCLEKYVLKLQKKKPVILVGDLNCARLDIDVHNPKTCAKFAGFTPEERKSFDKLLKNTGLCDTYRHFFPEKKDMFTYWSYRQKARPKNRGWRIDYCLVSKSLLPKIKKAFIDDKIMGSDHCPVGIVI